MTKRVLLVAAAVLAAGVRVWALDSLAGASAARWSPCLGWVGADSRATQFGVSDEGGALVFRAEGANRQIPFLINLREEEISGDSRYLLVHYKGDGLSALPGEYFLHGVEGTPGGQSYAASDEVTIDGSWHTLAVDLLQVVPQEPTSAIAIKVIVGDVGKATLTVDRISFSDDLPADARVARVRAAVRRSVVFDWRQLTLTPQPAWTLTPATDFAATPDGSTVAFRAGGAGKGMRWTLTLPEAVDLAAMPLFSVRYRATGQISTSGYALWLGDDASGAQGHSLHPLLLAAVKADGAWHNLTVRLGQSFKATQLAVGLDAVGEQATLTLDSITFGSHAPQWPLAQVLAYEPRAGAWPAGQDGFTVMPPHVSGGRTSAFLSLRLGIADWFTSSRLSVGGIPFDVLPELAQVRQSGTCEMAALEAPLPASAREVYLLTAAAAPATEPWGIDSLNPRPQEVLTEPEKAVCEIRYQSGPPDFMLPLQAAAATWGLKRGIAVHVVHPDPTRQATALLLHDNMQTASFAILGVTVNSGTPRVREPTWEHLALHRPGQPLWTGSRDLVATFDTQAGLAWSQLSVRGVAGALGCAQGPVFEVSMGGKVLPAADWAVVTTAAVGAGTRYQLRNQAAQLSASVDCVPGEPDGVLLRMALRNEGTEPVTTTLRFPVLRGVTLGSAADTWYLSGHRGGIINSANTSFRDPLGENHPLQVDGFFNPTTGLALACLTHDTQAQHHFIRLAKTDGGGEWSPEYPERDLAPGATFTATEAALQGCAGDWRAIFGTYRQWLATWYQPPLAKPWWERTFAFITVNAHFDVTADPKQRGALQPTIDIMREYMGVCDYVHLYGCWATPQYGEWGDYDHYDESVGGKDWFRANIAAAQAAGIGVGTYQDGYLNCDKGQFSGAHAKEWAIKLPDQTPQYIKEYAAYNECPTLEPWRQYLIGVYGRIHRDFGLKGMYIDEMGATDGRWICRAKDHGHNGYEIPYAAEVAMLKGIRAAVGPEVALYTEYPPAEVSRQILDGSFTYQALWSVDQEPLAPHFIDLPRFAFPRFKQFHIIYYVATRAGNWWLLKIPFFNGESYDLGVPNLPNYDAASRAFQRQALQVLCAHREAFSSEQVEPLVPTAVAGVFANRFSAAKETVWTLYNANGRTVRGALLRVPQVAGATYEDAWNGTPLSPVVSGGFASLPLELGPKGIGCVVQSWP
jgi:hypothetical protein